MFGLNSPLRTFSTPVNWDFRKTFEIYKHICRIPRLSLTAISGQTTERQVSEVSSNRVPDRIIMGTCGREADISDRHTAAIRCAKYPGCHLQPDFSPARSGCSRTAAKLGRVRRRRCFLPSAVALVSDRHASAQKSSAKAGLCATLPEPRTSYCAGRPCREWTHYFRVRFPGLRVRKSSRSGVQRPR
jgi:hypothetical protein